MPENDWLLKHCLRMADRSTFSGKQCLSARPTSLATHRKWHMQHLKPPGQLAAHERQAAPNASSIVGNYCGLKTVTGVMFCGLCPVLQKSRTILSYCGVMVYATNWRPSIEGANAQLAFIDVSRVLVMRYVDCKMQLSDFPHPIRRTHCTEKRQQRPRVKHRKCLISNNLVELPGKDSNLERGNQNPLCYHYTTGY